MPINAFCYQVFSNFILNVFTSSNQFTSAVLEKAENNKVGVIDIEDFLARLALHQVYRVNRTVQVFSEKESTLKKTTVVF